MSQMHNCPAVGCTWSLSADKLMCAQHWRLVPVFLQRDINRYWKQTNNGDHHSRLAAIHNYRVARDAAIDHVNKLLQPLTA